MALGTVDYVLLCRPGFAASPHIPCPVGTGAVAVEAYVIEPAAVDFFESLTAPYDPALGAAFFLTAFCTTIFITWVAWQGGTILEVLKRVFR